MTKKLSGRQPREQRKKTSPAVDSAEVSTPAVLSTTQPPEPRPADLPAQAADAKAPDDAEVLARARVAESAGVKLYGEPLQRASFGRGPQLLIPIRSASMEHAARAAYEQALRAGIVIPSGSPPSTSPQRVLRFKKLPGGTIGVVKLVRVIPNTTLLNTYNELVRTFDDIRTVASRPKPISPRDLAKGFRHTSLGRVATPAHWEEWLQKFRSGELTVRNAALVFLKDATRLEIKTLKSRLSRARNPESSAKQPRATESNL